MISRSKVLSYGTVLYLTVSTNDVLNTNKNETDFPELTRFFEEHFEIKVQEGYFLKYLNLLIWQSHIGFSDDQNNHIMGLLNEWFLTGKFRKVDTPFGIDSIY